MSQPKAHGTAATAAASPAPPMVGLGSSGVAPATLEVPEPAGWLRRAGRVAWVRETAVLAAFLAAGIAATWPRASYFTGKLPHGPDQAQYVWNMWWVAHQLIHLGNPWFTRYLAAPAGIPLGLATLTPLPGVVLTPVTLLFGPSASYNLLVTVMPGLAGYAMWRAARLWVPSPVGAIAAGVFFGLSGMFAFQDWYHLHTAAGCVFLPLTLETAVLMRRDPTIRRGVVLGLVLGASMLVDQQLSVMAVVLAVLVLSPWLIRHRGAAAVRATAAGAVTSIVVASPQLVAMVQALGTVNARQPGSDYVKFSGELPSMFAPSPRLSSYGLTGLGSVFHAHTSAEGLTTFGVVLSVLAGLGLAVSWQRRGARPLGVLWLGSAVLALGPTLYIAGHQYVPLAHRWDGIPVSLLMPGTWLIRVPGLASFREPDRFTLLGLVGAALLAGAAVAWLAQRSRPAIVAVAVLAALEAGWPGAPGVMPTALPSVDRPIAADHSGSVVVDVPFGLRGLPEYGKPISPMALVLAATDGHPRAVSYSTWVPRRALTATRSHSFYTGLTAARLGRPISPAQISAARRDLPRLHIGWVLVWLRQWMALPRRHRSLNYAAITRYLTATGFRFDYQANGVKVYRPGGNAP